MTSEGARGEIDALSSIEASIVQMLDRVPELRACLWEYLDQEQRFLSYVFAPHVADFMLDVAQSLLDADGRFQQPEEILQRLPGFLLELATSGDHFLVTFLWVGILEEVNHEHPAFETLVSRIQPLFPRFSDKR